MKRGAVIFLCDLTGNAAKPWAEAGYDAFCVDIQHSIRRDRVEAHGAGRVHFVWGDVRSWSPPRQLDLVFGASFSECTHVAGSGARDWPKKRGYMLRDALEQFENARMVLREHVLDTGLRIEDVFAGRDLAVMFDGDREQILAETAREQSGRLFSGEQFQMMVAVLNANYRLDPDDAVCIVENDLFALAGGVSVGLDRTIHVPRIPRDATEAKAMLETFTIVTDATKPYADPEDALCRVHRGRAVARQGGGAMSQHRALAPELWAAIAYHEAGHAVADVLAYRELALPPTLRPSIKYAAITREDDGKHGGICFGSNVYHPAYMAKFPDWQWRDALQWQITSYLAGGVAEAIHRGERNKRDVMWFALLNCGTEDDLEDAEAVLADLRRLTGRNYGLQRFTLCALQLLLSNWGAVEAIAAALIRDHHIDGSEIDAIVRRGGRS